MNELQQALIGDSAAAAPNQILDGLANDLALRTLAGAPHTIYQELWHVTFWQQVTLDWVNGIETPFPQSPSAGFPPEDSLARESWEQLCQRFLRVIMRPLPWQVTRRVCLNQFVVLRARVSQSASCQ